MRAAVEASLDPTKVPEMFGGLVGAHLRVRPWAKAACVQRADTWVGPYRGSKGILDFEEVAGVECEHGRGMPRPYRGQMCLVF